MATMAEIDVEKTLIKKVDEILKSDLTRDTTNHEGKNEEKLKIVVGLTVLILKNMQHATKEEMLGAEK